MADKNEKSEQRREVGAAIPAYSPELGNRISSVIRLLGGLKKAAGYAGRTDETVAAWRDGKTDPSFYGLWGMARAAGVSLDWLATGRGDKHVGTAPAAEIDQELLEMIIDELERFREDRRLEWDARTRARLISLGYDMMLAEREKGRNPTTSDLQYLLKAAS